MKIGVQLYTLRDFCKDTQSLSETLKKVAEGVKSDAKYLILIGTNDKYQNLIIDHQDELRQDFLLNVPKPEVRDALFEKKDFYQTCEHYEMPIPKTYYYDCDVICFCNICCEAGEEDRIQHSYGNHK